MDNSQIKILLVDDDPDILEIIEYNLQTEKYQVFTATNGKKAIAVAVKEIPHLIILDVMMPVMDGIEACEHLRNLPQLDHTIITFLTARAEDYSQVAGFNAGADDYIAKPIRPKVLLSKIKALLRRLETKKNNEKKLIFSGPPMLLYKITKIPWRCRRILVKQILCTFL
ncbi:MAG: response regulator [Draconibacterium sp.]|nr:response regulator [Draconibacterium sp.]